MLKHAPANIVLESHRFNILSFILLTKVLSFQMEELYKLLNYLPLLLISTSKWKFIEMNAINLSHNSNVMGEVLKLDSVAEFNAIRGQETLHPLVSVLDQSKSQPVAVTRFYSGLYIVFLKEVKCGELRYGRNQYDYQEGTLLFIAPGQILLILLHSSFLDF